MMSHHYTQNAEQVGEQIDAENDRTLPMSNREDSEVSSRSGKRMFHCHLCKYVTDRKNNLKRHVITMHESCAKSLECCDCVFPNKASLRDHVITHHQKGYVCSVCGRNFCRKALLKRHITVHSGQKDYTCEVCGYATSHKSNLDRHKRRHLPKDVRYQYFRSITSLPALYRPQYAVPTQAYRNNIVSTNLSQTFTDREQYHDNRVKLNHHGPSATYGKRRETRDTLRDLEGDKASTTKSTQRPKIWNPAFNDDVRYCSKSCETGKLAHTDCNYGDNYGPSKLSGREKTTGGMSRYNWRPDEKTRDLGVIERQHNATNYSIGSKVRLCNKPNDVISSYRHSTQVCDNKSSNRKGKVLSDFSKSHFMSVMSTFEVGYQNTTLRSPFELSNDASYCEWPLTKFKTPQKRTVRILQRSHECRFCDASFCNHMALLVHSETSHPVQRNTSALQPKMSIQASQSRLGYF